MITGLNHITFAVSDLNRSLEFYRDVLGCKEVYCWESGAYLEAGSFWLCLSVDPSATGNSDYTHVAFDVPEENFEKLSERIRQSGAQLWQENRSEGGSLYFCCPDGHRLEVHVGNLISRLHSINEKQDNRCGSAQ